MNKIGEFCCIVGWLTVLLMFGGSNTHAQVLGNDYKSEIEPNDTISQAMLMNSKDVIASTFGDYDTDLYKIEVVLSGFTQINVEVPVNLQKNLNFYVLNSSGAVVSESDFDGYAEFNGFSTFLQTGTYYIKLSYGNTAQTNNTYRISWYSLVPTPPNSPIVNEVTDQSTSVTGTAEVGTVIIVKTEGSVLGMVATEDDGTFSVPISLQKAGTILSVTAMDNEKDESKAAIVVVKDVTSPSKPVVNGVTENDTTVTGQAEAFSKVQIKVNGIVIASSIADQDGKYTITIPVQKAGTQLVITATDEAGNVSEAVMIVVKDVTAPSKPVVNDVTDKDTLVTGQAEVGSKVEVKVSGVLIGNATVGTDGKFTVAIPAQKAGTELSITAADQTGNVSETVIVVVKDITAPLKPVVSDVTDKDTTITGQAEAGSRVEVKVNGSVIGFATVGTDGRFSIIIPVQKAGTVLIITATDNFGNKSNESSITVKAAIVVGWNLFNNKWYYYNSQGVPFTGWQKIGLRWYYFDQTGVMQTGWLKSGTSWYYLESSGAMKTGWLKDGSSWYYLSSIGSMKTGWLKDGSSWYYLSSSGSMKTGWVKVRTKWYYFYNNGKMAYSTRIGFYRLAADGSLIN